MLSKDQIKQSLSQQPEWLKNRLHRLQRGRATALDLLWARPWGIMPEADPWQAEILADRRSNYLICASRQSGKSTVVAAKAAWLALTEAKFVLVVSRSEDQAFEFFAKVMESYHRFPLVEPLRDPTMSELRLVNGGRVLALPHSEETIRGYSAVDTLVMDEAAMIKDNVFVAVGPMLAVKKGNMIALSTPKGQRGWMWEEFHDCELAVQQGRKPRWKTVNVPWTMCPRITPEFIETERMKPSVGPVGVAQEYECEWLPASANCPIDVEAMQALLDDVRGWR